MVLAANQEPDVFGAISHPARRRMLDLLAETDRSVSALAGHFQMSRPAVSQHLRILLDSGLVTEQRHGRERRYHLVPERLGPMRAWLAQYERFWDDRLRRLQARLLTTKSNKQKSSAKSNHEGIATTSRRQSHHRQTLEAVEGVDSTPPFALDDYRALGSR